MGSQAIIPVWLDCDPGHDDAFAILLAAHHPSLHLLGLSTIHGNSSLQHTTHNASSILTAIGRPSIPVHAGSSCGLTRPSVRAPSIHGESGLDGTSLLPTPLVSPSKTPAVPAMYAALSSTEPGTAWLVATGALTNIAKLFTAHPDLATHIAGLSIMGGSVGNHFTDAPMGTINSKSRIGNWTQWAEFNILVDPEAADLLFSNPILNKKITLIPLDVTHLVLATKSVQDLLLKGKNGNEKSTLRTMLVELLTFFAGTYAAVFGITTGPPLHDPLAVAAIVGLDVPFYDFKEGVGKRERYEVKVVTEGTHEDAKNGAQTGRTVVRLLDEGEEGVRIPRSLDVEKFWRVLEECLGRADEVNRSNGVL